MSTSPREVAYSLWGRVLCNPGCEGPPKRLLGPKVDNGTLFTSTQPQLPGEHGLWVCCCHPKIFQCLCNTSAFAPSSLTPRLRTSPWGCCVPSRDPRAEVLGCLPDWVLEALWENCPVSSLDLLFLSLIGKKLCSLAAPPFCPESLTHRKSPPRPVLTWPPPRRPLPGLSSYCLSPLRSETPSKSADPSLSSF